MLPREQEIRILRTQQAALAKSLLNINLHKSAQHRLWQQVLFALDRVHTSILLWFSKKRLYLQFIPTPANLLCSPCCPPIHAGLYKAIISTRLYHSYKLSVFSYFTFTAYLYIS